MAEFRLDDVVTLVYADHHPEYAGQPCKIIGPLAWRHVWLDLERTKIGSIYAYRVQMDDGSIFAVSPDDLSSLVPPDSPEFWNTKVSWHHVFAVCGWAPK